MTYMYYHSLKRNTTAPTTLTSKEAEEQFAHLSDKSNWRIVQLSNGYYQTEVCDKDDNERWHDITRRASIEEAEAAIDGSISHFAERLETIQGPTVVKTFNK